MIFLHLFLSPSFSSLITLYISKDSYRTYRYAMLAEHLWRGKVFVFSRLVLLFSQFFNSSFTSLIILCLKDLWTESGCDLHVSIVSNWKHFLIKHCVIFTLFIVHLFQFMNGFYLWRHHGVESGKQCQQSIYRTENTGCSSFILLFSLFVLPCRLNSLDIRKGCVERSGAIMTSEQFIRRNENTIFSLLLLLRSFFYFSW